MAEWRSVCGRNAAGEVSTLHRTVLCLELAVLDIAVFVAVFVAVRTAR